MKLLQTILLYWRTFMYRVCGKAPGYTPAPDSLKDLFNIRRGPVMLGRNAGIHIHVNKPSPPLSWYGKQCGQRARRRKSNENK